MHTKTNQFALPFSKYRLNNIIFSFKNSVSLKFAKPRIFLHTTNQPKFAYFSACIAWAISCTKRSIHPFFTLKYFYYFTNPLLSKPTLLTKVLLLLHEEPTNLRYRTSSWDFYCLNFQKLAILDNCTFTTSKICCAQIEKTGKEILLPCVRVAGVI